MTGVNGCTLGYRESFFSRCSSVAAYIPNKITQLFHAIMSSVRDWIKVHQKKNQLDELKRKNLIDEAQSIQQVLDCMLKVASRPEYAYENEFKKTIQSNIENELGAKIDTSMDLEQAKTACKMQTEALIRAISFWEIPPIPDGLNVDLYILYSQNSVKPFKRLVALVQEIFNRSKSRLAVDSRYAKKFEEIRRTMLFDYECAHSELEKASKSTTYKQAGKFLELVDVKTNKAVYNIIKNYIQPAPIPFSLEKLVPWNFLLRVVGGNK
ncbi:MAG: hypothetical protein HZB76_00615 [Chlamydiae bacterium]|nr:hypothetical protein [Chlamydiota bacterium]